MIVLMSMLFMAFTVMTYMTHRNWREAAVGTGTPLGYKYQLENAKKKLQDKDNEMGRIRLDLAQEKAARTEAIGGLEGKTRNLQDQLDEQQVKLTNEQSEKDRSILNTETAQSEMQRIKDELGIVRDTLKKTLDDRNQKLARVTELTDQLSQSRTELGLFKEQNTALRSQLARAKLVLVRNDLDEFTPVDNVPPDLDGLVTRVRESDLVEVSLGADEGLRRGHKLDIFRKGGSYIGRVVVVETSSDRAVARIIPDFLQGTIRRGDRVATKLL